MTSSLEKIFFAHIKENKKYIDKTSDFNGFNHNIKFIESNVFDNIIVSTDDEEIAEINVSTNQADADATVEALVEAIKGWYDKDVDRDSFDAKEKILKNVYPYRVNMSIWISTREHKKKDGFCVHCIVYILT